MVVVTHDGRMVGIRAKVILKSRFGRDERRKLDGLETEF